MAVLAEDIEEPDNGSRVVITKAVDEQSATVILGEVGYIVLHDEDDDSYLVQVEEKGIEVWLFEDEFVVSSYQDEDVDSRAPAVGMSSGHLAEYVAEFVENCVSRIVGVGAEQYEDEDHQKFETLSLDELLEYAQEEVEDIANYAAMLHIRIRRIREALGRLS